MRGNSNINRMDKLTDCDEAAKKADDTANGNKIQALHLLTGLLTLTEAAVKSKSLPSSAARGVDGKRTPIFTSIKEIQSQRCCLDCNWYYTTRTSRKSN